MSEQTSPALRGQILSLIGITALAAGLRLAWIGSLPPGLYHDEAFNGLDALRVLAGEHPIFFEANNGREPLFIYLTALSVGLLGRTPGALRIVSAIIGTLTVPAAYGMVRSLWGRHRLAIFTAALAALNVWALNLSRIAFRAVLLPLLSAVMLAFLGQGLKRKPWAMVAAGAFCGLTLYSYLAARFIPIAVGGYALYMFVRERRRFWWRGWLLFAVAAGLVALPIALYWLTHWEAMMARAAQVSIWNPAIGGPHPWRTLAQNIVKVALGFVWRGDFIPRHNIPLRPVFDPLMAAAFLAGLVVAARRARHEGAWALGILWLGVLLLPTILAEDAPHFIRASGILPVVFVFPAAGLEAFWAWASRRWPKGWPSAMVCALLGVSGASGLVAYWQHVHSEAAYYQFETGAVTLAREVNTALGRGWQGGLSDRPKNALPSGRQVLIAHRLWANWANVRFLSPAGEGLGILTPEGKVPADFALGEDVTLFLWPFEDCLAPLRALPSGAFIRVREGAYERGDLEAESRLLYVVIRGQSLVWAPKEAQGAPLARWREGIGLIHAEQEIAPDGTLQLRLVWRAERPPNGSWTVFRHALCDGRLIGQKDGPPAQGYYPTELWRAGDVIEDIVNIPVSEPFDSAHCEIRVGWYHWPSGERLAVQEASLPVLEGTAVTLK